MSSGPTFSSKAFTAPPCPRTADGEPRHVGFELELQGMELPKLAELVAEVTGGSARRENPYRYSVTGTADGDYTVEADWDLLRKTKVTRGVARMTGTDALSRLTAIFEETLAQIAKPVVPLEVVTPPIPLDRLGVVEELRHALCWRGAEGTGASLTYAFGLHLNPQAPALDTRSILSHLRAFLVLYEWLIKVKRIDVTRRVAPFIKPFPEDYVKLVLSPCYRPGRTRLIDDYLEANPTRNRPLDLLPLFAHLDFQRVRARVDDELVSARPTYHYRLPCCHVDDPDWRIAREWHEWVLVERLADDEEHLAEMCRAYHDRLTSPLSFLRTPWHHEAASWVELR